MSKYNETLYMVCDDTHNDPSVDEVDLSMVPPEVTERVLAAIDAVPYSKQATA